MVIFGLTGVRLFTKIVECPKGVLLPLIVVLSIVGTYAIQNSITDVYWMLGFGVLGYFMKMYGYQVAPVILGIILGPLMDLSYRRAMISVQDSVPAFFWEFLVNPISLTLTIAVLLLILNQTPLWPRRRRAATQET